MKSPRHSAIQKAEARQWHAEYRKRPKPEPKPEVAAVDDGTTWIRFRREFGEWIPVRQDDDKQEE